MLYALMAAIGFLLLASGSGKLLKPASPEAFLRAINAPRGAALPLTILVSLLEYRLHKSRFVLLRSHTFGE